MNFPSSAVSADRSDVPLVSVVVITYNQARYVTRAIESIQQQKTDFPFEIVISDDCSTDHTPNILREFASADSRIRLNLRSKNVGAVRNYYSALQTCSGRFVAILEGDDFWIYPFKLQRQTDLLKRTGAVMCLHPCFGLFEFSNSMVSGTLLSRSCYRDPRDLAKEAAFIPTASVMFDRKMLPAIPPEYYTLYNGDAPIWMLLAARGEVRVIPERWSVYRIHSSGIWSSLSDGDKAEIVAKTTKVIAEVLGREPDRRSREWREFFLNSAKDHVHQEIINRVSCGRWRAARRSVWRYLFGLPRPRLIPPRHHWGLYLRIMLGKPSALMKKHEQNGLLSTTLS